MENSIESRNDLSGSHSANLQNKTIESQKLNNNSTSKLAMAYEDVDIDKYMHLVKEELNNIGYTLDKRAFIQNIINILDKLISPNKFNKMIFFHILDYGNLPRIFPHFAS